jgi:hypothetical protein
LFIATFVVQAGGLMAEISDPAAAGDDYGLVIAYAVGLIVSIVVYARSRERAVLGEPIPVENSEHPR